MTKLEELRQLVAESFKEATEKQDIERLAKINNAISEATVEQEELIAKNADLIKSYKDLVQHTSFKEDRSAATDDIAPTAISFEAALQDFMSKQGEK